MSSPTGISSKVSGCPTWIRTMTKASKGPCATITPSDKPEEKYRPDSFSAKKKLPISSIKAWISLNFKQKGNLVIVGRYRKAISA